MHVPFTRRRLLQAGIAAAALPLPVVAQPSGFAPKPGGWRRYALTTTVNVAEPQGRTQLWLPVPDIDSDWQRSLDNQWSGNATRAAIVSDPARGVRMLHAEFAPGIAAPTLTLTSVVETRDRAVDWQQPAGTRLDPAARQAYTAPTELQPVDGIVRDTAVKATQGARSDVDKARALYQWVVDNAFREPKTRGCGTGDIKAMLETGNLGGKCADLNALFVALCRAAGVPARDLYGVRLAPSSFGYQQLGSGSANLTGAQHCRAEVYLKARGWTAMDPADVAKVMRQERPEWIKRTDDPLIAPVYHGLYGAWEGNWMAYNTAHDIKLPGSQGDALGFFMYPMAENAEGWFDQYTPAEFRYKISASEVKA